MPKPTSAAKKNSSDRQMSVVLLTMDNHLSSTAGRVADQLKAQAPSLHFKTHAAANWRDMHLRCISKPMRQPIGVTTRKRCKVASTTLAQPTW